MAKNDNDRYVQGVGRPGAMPKGLGLIARQNSATLAGMMRSKMVGSSKRPAGADAAAAKTKK